MNKVVAVVLNYNTAKDSKKCLEYLLCMSFVLIWNDIISVFC